MKRMNACDTLLHFSQCLKLQVSRVARKFLVMFSSACHAALQSSSLGEKTTYMEVQWSEKQTNCNYTINPMTFPSVQRTFFVFVFDYFQLLVELLSPSLIYPQHCYLSLLLIICLLILMNSITSFQRKLLRGWLSLPEVSTNCEY